MEFTGLESAALAMMVEDYERELPGLAAQLALARPKSRDNTGNGFFTDIVLDESAVPISTGPGPLDGPALIPDGMEFHLEILLFFKDGRANLLEGFSTRGEDTSRVNFNAGKFNGLVSLWPPKRMTR